LFEHVKALLVGLGVPRTGKIGLTSGHGGVSFGRLNLLPKQKRVDFLAEKRLRQGE
jgi:hypothetical protein